MSIINQSSIEAMGTATPKSGGSILRLAGVLTRTGHKSHATIYDRIKRGTFPRPVPIGARAVGWPESEVEQINAAHIAGADESTIRLLVENIHRERATRLQCLMAGIAADPPKPAPASAGSVVELRGRA